MNTTYLLPCSCGRKIPVQLRQAGEIVKCDCGNIVRSTYFNWVKDPAKRRKPPPAQNSESIIGPLGHRLTFFGGLVILAAIVIGGWLFWTRPIDPYANFTPEQMHDLAAQISLQYNALQLWQMLERERTRTPQTRG